MKSKQQLKKIKGLVVIPGFKCHKCFKPIPERGGVRIEEEKLGEKIGEVAYCCPCWFNV